MSGEDLYEVAHEVWPTIAKVTWKQASHAVRTNWNLFAEKLAAKGENK